MRIYFRYLFMRVLVPFSVTLLGCAMIWIMIDLYGNLDDFLVHKIGVGKILYFYALQIPSVLVTVLPATLLFSTLWTLLSLNRRSELVAFQSGGMAPVRLFSPFVIFGVIWMLVLAWILSGPAAQSLVARQRILEQVKGVNAKINVFENLIYVDNTNHRVWFLPRLDLNQNTSEGMSLLIRDAQGHDITQYYSTSAVWNGDFWKLTKVKAITYKPDNTEASEKIYEEIDLPDVNTPPQQLSLIVSQPEQLTLPQLSQYISTSTSTEMNLVKYRTEWWYRIFHPFSLLVLMLYALLQGVRTDRRSAVMGVIGSIFVLFAYIALMTFFLTQGRNGHLPPFIAAIITQVIFGGLALHLLARSQGWWWQLHEYWKKWQAQRTAVTS